MKKVLVTGGTGFLGAYLLRELLQKGYQVRAIRREASPMHSVESIQHQVEWVIGDMLDLSSVEDAMEGIEKVYHAAAIVSFNPKDAERMIHTNTEGTANIVNTALSMGIKKMLHVSSIAALGRKENQSQMDESTQWENSSHNSSYAISKFKAECEVWRGVEEGLNATIINPSMIMGPGFWHNGTPKMFTQVNKGLRFCPKGANGFVDVRDVAKIAVQLTESEISGERFIVNSENLSYKSLFTQMAKALGKQPPRIIMPDWGVSILWRLDKLRSRMLGVEPLITKEIASSLQLVSEYDNQKIIKALDYQFLPMSQTISETATLFKSSKASGVGFAIAE